MPRTITAEGWTQRLDFNPLSPPQVMSYLKHQRYKIPLERSSGKETTNDEGLNSLLTHHYPEDQILPQVLRLRSDQMDECIRSIRSSLRQAACLPKPPTS